MKILPFQQFVVFILLFSQGTLFSQKTEDLMKMNLEDILDMDVTVFSVKGLTQQQTPGVMTVMTEDEIAASGARDLMDILHLVPGFEFGVDQQSVISLGVRGNWAQEGKVLLLIDGMEMNEILYSCLALGNHYPVEHIQRIEIIRGPGTSFYGNYAELSVVNIVTKSAVNLNGVESVWTYGRTADAESRNSVSLNFGQKIGGFKIKALSYAGRSLRSDRKYADIYGNEYSMEKESSIRPLFLNLGLDYRGLKADFILDRYEFDQRDAYVKILEKPIQVNFNTITSRLRYGIRLNDQLTLTPGVSYLRQEPWKSADQAALDNDFYYFNTAERLKTNLILNGNWTERFQFVSGAEFFIDRATVSDETPEEQYFSGGKKRLEYNQVSAFLQAFYTKGKTIPSLGLRYDRHNQFGAEFLPWVGITQMIGKWSLKYLFGQSYRAPSIENLNINQALKPEKSTTSEMELGYQISDNHYFILDYYHTRIMGPIVYFLDPLTEEELYGNYEKVGSQGVEFTSKHKGDWGQINFSYSFYKPIHMIENYRVESQPGLLLGFPAHKIALYGHLNVTSHLGINPSVVLTSKRFGYATVDNDTNYVIHEFSPKGLVNLVFQYSNLLNTKWDACFGIHNLFDVDYPFIQPYNSQHAPLPNLSREAVVSLKYRLN